MLTDKSNITYYEKIGSLTIIVEHLIFEDINASMYVGHVVFNGLVLFGSSPRFKQECAIEDCNTYITVFGEYY